MNIKLDDVKITMQLKNLIKHKQTQALLKKEWMIVGLWWRWLVWWPVIDDWLAIKNRNK